MEHLFSVLCLFSVYMFMNLLEICRQEKMKCLYAIMKLGTGIEDCSLNGLSSRGNDCDSYRLRLAIQAYIQSHDK